MPYYISQEKQTLFHDSQADETLYGGAVGGGKSYAIIWDAVKFALEVEQVTVSIFRRTYPELEKSIILEFQKSIPGHWYEYNKKEHRAYFKTTRSILEFNYCEFDADVFRYQSAQYDREYFDELTSFNKFIYTYLQSRCRTTNPKVKPQIKSATNPGNIGHFWVKERFIKDSIPNQVCNRVDPESGHMYTTLFIPAKIQDNKYLYENDPDYAKKRLMNLDAANRRMLLEGDWEAMQGQFFTEFRYDVHVVKPIRIPNYWTRIRCMDWGYSKPTAVLWIAISPKNEFYVYRELVVTETTDVKLAKKVIDLSRGEKIDYTVADPSMWSMTQFERGESIAMRLTQLGLPLIKADNNRVAGWNIVHSYLEWDTDVEPKLKIFNNCHYLIETLPAAIHDDKRPEDIDTQGDDHALDALRYGLMSKPLVAKAPVKSSNPNSFDYWLNKKYRDRQKKGYVGSI